MSTVRVADVDEDGNADLVAMSLYGGQTILGRGDGSFRAPAFLAAPARLDAAVAADLNGDGLADVVGAGGAGLVVAFVGNGDGTFAASMVTTAASFAAPLALAAADLDGDGDEDVVVERGTAALPLLSAGDGTFVPRPEAVAGSALAFALARLDGDAHPDLAVANGSEGTVSVLRGNGDGTFLARTTFPAGGAASHAAVADVDADGALDLVVGNGPQNTVSVLRGRGDATFEPPRSFPVPLVSAAGAADLDLDGRPDLVVTAWDGTRVLYADWSGGFAAAETSIGRGSETVAIADVDGDGHPDAVTRVAVLLARPGGYKRSGFDVATSSTMGPYADVGLKAAIAGDVNGDGRSDMVGLALEGLIPLVSTCAP